jgi:hypothetical protein
MGSSDRRNFTAKPESVSLSSPKLAALYGRADFVVVGIHHPWFCDSTGLSSINWDESGSAWK